MLLIPCPWCGPRDENEFSYGGAADAVMPPLDGRSTLAAWHRFVHLRANPDGPHRELWHHSCGCGRWLRVTRDTRTHRILAATDAGRPG